MNYDINYDDPKFKNVESQKQAALTENNNTYDNMINQSDKYYQDQINAVKDYGKQQQEIQQANTDFAIEQINQQKDQAAKDYKKEQSGAYVDWQKQSNQYGANAEQQAAQGLNNTGYSESSQVSMYNTYQNRVATARESFNKAILNYDNAIKDAQLQNNSKLAEIAFNTLQTQLELNLQGFQYKNQLILDKVAQNRSIDSEYYSRYQDVLKQMNTENTMKEQIRQYNQNFAQQEKEYQEGIRQFNTQMEYYKQKDAKEYAYKIKQLEEQKRQFEQEYKLKKKQMEQSQAQWQAEYNLAKKKTSSIGSRSPASVKKDTTKSVKKDTTNSVSANKKNTKSSSMAGVSRKEYNNALKSLRTLVGLQTNKTKKRQIAEDFLARTNLSDTQIISALKSVGL